MSTKGDRDSVRETDLVRVTVSLRGWGRGSWWNRERMAFRWERVQIQTVGRGAGCRLRQEELGAEGGSVWGAVCAHSLSTQPGRRRAVPVEAAPEQRSRSTFFPADRPQANYH